MAREIVLDTYIPKLTGFETTIADSVDAPFTMETHTGTVYISGRRVTTPKMEYVYPASQDTYEDLILHIQSLGTGDGSQVAFTTTLNVPAAESLLVTTVAVNDGKSLLTDTPGNLLESGETGYVESYDGTGVFKGDGFGTINYATGVIEVTFNTAPAAGIPIEVSLVSVLRSSTVIGSVEPFRLESSTRLQKVTTGPTSITSREILANTEWDRPVFLTGRVFQAREANEIVSILENKIKNVGDAIFTDGDLVSGGQVRIGDYVADTDGNTKLEVHISAGKFYLQGAVRKVPAATVLISGTGRESVGLRVVRSWITEDIDSSLRDISTGWDGSGFPGAYREHVEITWRANDDNSIKVYRFFNGSPLKVPANTEFSKIEKVLARRTFLESGNYKVYGFKPSFSVIRYKDSVANSTGTLGAGELVDDRALWLNFDSGVAFVQGFEVFKPQSSRQRWRKAIDTKTVTSEGLIYKPTQNSTQEIYPLEHVPVSNVYNVSGIARTPLMKITKASSGDLDDLPTQSVEALDYGIQGFNYTGIPNTQDAARVTLYPSREDAEAGINAYVEGNIGSGADFQVNSTGNSITWGAGKGASTYYGYWNYDTSQGPLGLVKGTRLLKRVTQTLTMAANSSDLRHVVNLAHGDLSKYVRVYSDTIEYSYGIDYRINPGRTTGTSNLIGKLVWKPNKRRPDQNDTYYIEYEYWDHTIALWDNNPMFTEASRAEGDYVVADSYLEELPDPLPDDYQGSLLQFPNATDPNQRTKFFRILRNPRGLRNSVIEGRKITKNRNSIDFRPLGAKTSEEQEARNMAVRPASAGADAGKGYQVNYSYAYFLPRSDSVRLKKSGRFALIYGEPGSQSFPGGYSERVLPLLQISSRPNSRYPRVTENSIYRSTMADIQIMKERLNKLEVDFVTNALEQSALSSGNSSSALLRGVFIDNFRNFDFMDTDYENTPPDPVEPLDWQPEANYVFSQTVKRTDSPDTSYFRCIRPGVSGLTEPSWNAAAGEITNGDGTVSWRAYGYEGADGIKEFPIKCDASINNLSSSLSFHSYMSFTDMLPNPADRFGVSNQLILLPYNVELDNTQVRSSGSLLINGNGMFSHPLSVQLSPSCDIGLDLTDNPPHIETNFPGSTPSNLSQQYAEDSSKSGIGENDAPIHPLPDYDPYGRIGGWEGEFHLGIPIDTMSISSSIAPGLQVPVTIAGDPTIDVGYATDPDLIGAGFVSNYAQITNSAQFEKVNDTVVSTALTRYIRPRVVEVTGSGFPPGQAVSATFSGVPISFFSASLGTVKPDGTILPVSSISSPFYCGFVAKFLIPEGLPTGKHDVVFQAGTAPLGGWALSTSATYIAQGNIERVSSNWASILTNTHDMTGDFAPIAQSFVPKKDGYIQNINLYFGTKGTDNFPIELQIRDMVDGFPGPTVLGRSIVQGKDIKADGNGRTATLFGMIDPVYVRAGTPYCFCLRTASRDCRLAIGTVGATAAEDGVPITKQMDVGMLFTSNNILSWTTDVTSDLKFKIGYCNFTKNTRTFYFKPDWVSTSMTHPVATSLMLGATQLLPPGTQVNWSISVDGGTHFFPIKPSLLTTVNNIWRGAILKADMVGDYDDNQSVNTDIVSPAINKQHIGLFSRVACGLAEGYNLQGREKVESNYISENIVLDYPIQRIKVINEEFRPISTQDKIEVSYSPDNGSTWVQMPNAGEGDGIESSAAAVTLGSTDSKVTEVTRTMDIRKINNPSTTTTATYTTGGYLTSGSSYYVAYTFKGINGETETSTPVTVNVPVGTNTNRIVITLPTGSNFPEHASYNSNKPSMVETVYVYMGSSADGVQRLADSSYAVTFTTDPLTGKKTGGTVNITKDDLIEDEDLLDAPTVNSTQPSQFKVRVRLLATYNDDLVKDSATPGDTVNLPAFTNTAVFGSINVSSGGTIPAGDYSVVYTWVSPYGETRPSPELDGATHDFVTIDTADSLVSFWAGGTQWPTVQWPAGATAARFYIKEDGDTDYYKVNVYAKRGGVVGSYSELMRSDLPPDASDLYELSGSYSGDGYQIRAISNTVADLPTENTTGGLTKSSPQVSKLRVIAMDTP